jgi:hypothetical protein
MEFVLSVLITVLAILVLVVLLGLGMSARIVKQYEEGVLFRLGRVVGERSPGFQLIIPFVDVLHRVSLRIVTMPIQSQGIITRDNVSVDVSAVAYFKVVDAEKSVVAIENVYSAIDQIAQTTLRKDLSGLFAGHREHHPAKLQPRVLFRQAGTVDDALEPLVLLGAATDPGSQVARRAGGALDPAGRRGDLLADSNEIPQLRVRVKGLHDLVVSDRGSTAGPVQIGPVLLQPHCPDHRGRHRGRFLALDSQHVGGVAALAGIQHIEGAFVDLGEHGHLDRHIGLDDRRESMLAIDQHSGDVEGDALMGDPSSRAFRVGLLATYRVQQGKPRRSQEGCDRWDSRKTLRNRSNLVTLKSARPVITEQTVKTHVSRMLSLRQVRRTRSGRGSLRGTSIGPPGARGVRSTCYPRTVKDVVRLARELSPA